MSKKEKKELKKAFDELIKGVSNIEIVPMKNIALEYTPKTVDLNTLSLIIDVLQDGFFDFDGAFVRDGEYSLVFTRTNDYNVFDKSWYNTAIYIKYIADEGTITKIEKLLRKKDLDADISKIITFNVVGDYNEEEEIELEDKEELDVLGLEDKVNSKEDDRDDVDDNEDEDDEDSESGKDEDKNKQI